MLGIKSYVWPVITSTLEAFYKLVKKISEKCTKVEAVSNDMSDRYDFIGDTIGDRLNQMETGLTHLLASWKTFIEDKD